MPETSLNGIIINYEVAGDGPAVLLTHGYSATGRMWRPQAEALKDRYRIISWDMRGHGQTDSPDDPSQYSEDLTIGDMLASGDARYRPSRRQAFPGRFMSSPSILRIRNGAPRPLRHRPRVPQP
jgi:pimeloyl-ACP methyl ester carboxylesterase